MQHLNCRCAQKHLLDKLNVFPRREHLAIISVVLLSVRRLCAPCMIENQEIFFTSSLVFSCKCAPFRAVCSGRKLQVSGWAVPWRGQSAVCVPPNREVLCHTGLLCHWESLTAGRAHFHLNGPRTPQRNWHDPPKVAPLFFHFLIRRSVI